MNKRNTILLWIVLGLLLLGIAKRNFWFWKTTSHRRTWVTESVMPNVNVHITDLEIPEIPDIPEIPEIPAIPAIPIIPDFSISGVSPTYSLDSIPCPIVINYNTTQQLGSKRVKRHILYPNGYKREAYNAVPDRNEALYIDVNGSLNSNILKLLRFRRTVKVSQSWNCTISYPEKINHQIELKYDTLNYRHQLEWHLNKKMSDKEANEVVEKSMQKQFRNMENGLVNAALEKMKK